MTQGYLPALRYKALTRFYDPIVKITTRERVFKDALINQARIPDDATVVDIGCGTGTLAVEIKQAFPRATVIGLDADPEILMFAREKASRAGVDVEFVEGFADNLPFLDGSAERVLSSLFFHHLLNAEKLRVMRDIFRVLANDGELHVADWDAPANLLMRMAFLPVRILDGFPNTLDNVCGRLPDLMRSTGARDVARGARFNTIFGTLSLFRAMKA